MKAILWEERECIGVVKELITECPINGDGERNRQSENLQSGQTVDGFELSGLPHGMHNLPATLLCTKDLGKIITTKVDIEASK